jgi:hypothetical protein
LERFILVKRRAELKDKVEFGDLDVTRFGREEVMAATT